MFHSLTEGCLFLKMMILTIESALNFKIHDIQFSLLNIKESFVVICLFISFHHFSFLSTLFYITLATSKPINEQIYYSTFQLDFLRWVFWLFPKILKNVVQEPKLF